MNDFLKKDKYIIIVFSIIIITIFSYLYKSSAYTYESIDFKYGKVKTKTSLNVRCGPGINYDKVGKLKDGEYINVFAKVGEWYIIQTNRNLVGAVSSKYIEAIYNEEEILNNNLEDVKDAVSTETSSINITSSEYLDNIELTQDEKDFLNLINKNRIDNGLNELKIDKTVQNVARLKAQDLERNDYFSHTSPNYGNIDAMLKSFNVSFLKVQENIAGNQNLQGAIDAWMNSESHKSNILNNDFNYTGIAIVDSSTYGKIFVEVFVQK